MTYAPPTRPELLASLTAAVQAGFPSTVAGLSRLVRIPSVSWAAFDPQQVERSADAVAALAPTVDEALATRRDTLPSALEAPAPEAGPARADACSSQAQIGRAHV